MTYSTYDSTQSGFGLPTENRNVPDDIRKADLPTNAPTAGTNGIINLHPIERVASGITGAALTAFAATQRRDAVGGLLALFGGYMVYRGVTGYCPGYAALHTGTAREADSSTSLTTVIPHGQGVKVEKVMTINRSASELYDFWRNFENLPQFMKHLESVSVDSEQRSHWVARAPFGKTVSWDAEIINEIPGELIAWRSVDPADIPNTGSVRFKALPAGRGTAVKVNLEYNPPAGLLGAAIAKLWGEEPNQQVLDDLRRFKSLMETGEIPTTQGQPQGNATGHTTGF